MDERRNTPESDAGGIPPEGAENTNDAGAEMTGAAGLPIVVTDGGAKDSAEKPPETSMADEAKQLFQWIYTNNPFYVISAGLMFWGLRSSFDTRVESFETRALLIGLAGYTALLAVSACCLIRFGKVWEDARSMLVLIVLMFLAISVSFDDTLAGNPSAGTVYFLGGLALAVVVSEVLLFGMPLRLPVLFRVPYYLVLAVFFLYPVALAPLIYDPANPGLHWAMFGFSATAGVAFLFLLPAVRRGPEYVRDNGSPWPWPWYPWVLFGTLGVGVLGRAYYLCYSFHFIPGSNTIFGTYFWIPFLLAVSVLVLEIGIVTRNRTAMLLALSGPVGLLLLGITVPGERANDFGFLRTFIGTLGGTPLFVTLIATVLFYLVAALRRVPWAWDALCVAGALFCVCGPDTVGLSTLIGPWGLPLVPIAVLQLLTALRRRNALRCVVAVSCIVLAAAIDFQGTSFTAYHGFVPFHLLLGSLLIIGATARDEFGRIVQYLGAVLILLAGIASTVVDPRHLESISPVLLDLYPLAAIVAAVAYGHFVGNRSYYLSALAIAGSWVVLVGWDAYRVAREMISGLDAIVWGAIAFVVATLISLTKAGLPQRWLTRRREGQCGTHDSGENTER